MLCSRLLHVLQPPDALRFFRHLRLDGTSGGDGGGSSSTGGNGGCGCRALAEAPFLLAADWPALDDLVLGVALVSVPSPAAESVEVP